MRHFNSLYKTLCDIKSMLSKASNNCPTHLQTFKNTSVTFIDVTDFVLTIRSGTARMTVNSQGEHIYGDTGAENDIYKSEKHDGNITIEGQDAEFMAEWRSCNDGYISLDNKIVANDDIVNASGYVYRENLDKWINAPVTINVLDNDILHPDLATLTILDSKNGMFLTTDDNAGDWTVNRQTGQITFEPNGNIDVVGKTYSVQYTIADKNGNVSNPALVSVTYVKE